MFVCTIENRVPFRSDKLDCIESYLKGALWVDTSKLRQWVAGGTQGTIHFSYGFNSATVYKETKKGRLLPAKTIKECGSKCPFYGSVSVFCGHDVDVPYCESAKKAIHSNAMGSKFPDFCPLEEVS